MHTHKVLIWTLVIVALVIGGVYGWHLYSTRIIVHEFDGTVTTKTPTLLTMKGYYYAPGHGEFQNGDGTQVQVTITPQTKITKTTIFFPRPDQLPDGQGFAIEDLPHQYASGSLDEIGTAEVIIVKSTQNIHNRASFTADSIEYILRTLQPQK